jgi:hypothetical protein
MWVMGVYVVIVVIVQFLASILADQKINNLPLLHVYTPLEFLCIGWFYAIALRGFVLQRNIWGMIIGFGVLSVLNSIFLQDITTFNTYARSLQGILVIILSLMWCYRALSEMTISRLEDEPVFWVNTGFLLYFSGGVLLFAFSNYILQINRSLNMYIWGFHALFSVLLYIFISIGLWKVR